MKVLLNFFITSIVLALGSAKLNNSSKISRHFILSENFSVNSTLNTETQIIEFQVHVRTKGWIGLGISRNGAMNGADIVIGGFNNDGIPYLEDRHGVGNIEPPLDSSQDWTLLSGRRNETHTILTFSRHLKTGDELEDLEITSDTLRMIWAYGDSSRVTYHGSINRGIYSVNFFDPAVDPISQKELEKIYKVWKTQKPVLVAPNDTVYMCSFFKAPRVTQTNHIVGFNMYIDRPELRRHVHHADLYRCSAPPGQNADEYFAPFMNEGYDCNYSPVRFPNDACGLFEFQWTIGGGITLFPDNLGMPIGDSSGKTEYYMTEVHYDNPDRRTDIQITAGFNIFYTDKLRETEVGHLQLGVMTNKTYALTIPPNSSGFVVSSHCPAECTSNIPPDGINVFAYLLHAHLSGRKLKLRHFRDGKELDVFAKDDYFDFGYQNNRRLPRPIKILPRDHLTYECTYDTNWKKGKVTIGGRAARDEMCQTFLLYYPRMNDINSCGSYSSQQKILNYMGVGSVYQYQGEIDATILSPQYMSGLKYSYIVENMNWTEEKRIEYQQKTRYEEQQAYCIPKYYYNSSFVMTKYPQLYLDNNQQNTTLTEKHYSTLILSTISLSFVLLNSIILIGLFYFVLSIIKSTKKEKQPFN